MPIGQLWFPGARSQSECDRLVRLGASPAAVEVARAQGINPSILSGIRGAVVAVLLTLLILRLIG